ncbi:potassium channel family protein [Flavobacterium sp.]|uniref:potassium channel family protein n=1 Tax=Flavobacterium sp. TaxID=239 RepID=UPI00352923CD
MFFIKTIVSFLKDDEYRDLLITTIIILAVGTITYHYLEGWSIIDSLYFSVVTLTTIGYGDFSPQTDSGKIFTIVYIVVGIGMILSFINTIQHHYTMMRHKEKRDIVKHLSRTDVHTKKVIERNNN